jgi:short-subunit dehydrogenase
MAETDVPETRKTAVITGASSGIGRATAQEFAKQGYNVVLAARTQKELDEAAKSAEEFGVETRAITTDTTDNQAVHNLANEAINAFGTIDVWVNNAGVYLTGKFEDLPLEDMRRTMDTNFFGYVHGSHAALNAFRKQGYGTLINVSSVNASAPQPYISIYSASKAAVRAFDESLRMELRLDGLHKDIHVSTVMPASIDTPLFQNAANYTGHEIQALEPVYDPSYVAKNIVALVKRPKDEVIIGPAGKLMALQNAFMPRSYQKWFSKFTQADQLSDRPAIMTEGNLYESVEAEHRKYGGWREKRMRGDQVNMGMGIALGASIAALAFGLKKLTSSKHKRHHGHKWSALHPLKH